MSTAQRCLICKEEVWTELVKDFTTSFVFCKSCNNKIEDEYESLIGTRCLAKWLRAIANILERG